MDESSFQIGVKALIENAKGEVLILHRPADPSPAAQWKEYWDLPGGRIKDEGIAETFIREVNEELGVKKIDIKELFDHGISRVRLNSKQGTVRLFLLIYLCSIPEETKIRLSSEHDSYKWVDKKSAGELLGNLFPLSLLEKLCQ